MFKIVKEAENDSQNILAQALISDQFKNNDNAKNTIFRATDLFKELSKDYNVAVNINNNGQTELRFKTSDNSNGYLQIMISGPTDKIRTYSNGIVELTDDVVNLINEIKKY